MSTVGLVPGIDRLADEGLGVTLAVSLHAPDDDLRDTLVPVNSRWKVADVLTAADRYAARTGRRYSVEYAMIRDVNDQPWRADLLGALLSAAPRPRQPHPAEPDSRLGWDASPKPVEQEFATRIRHAGVAVTVRDTRGRDIDGACGQLAATGRESCRCRGERPAAQPSRDAVTGVRASSRCFAAPRCWTAPSQIRWSRS